MGKRSGIALNGTVAILCWSRLLLAQDVRNAVEPPIVGRYEGSVIKEQSVRAFDRATMSTRADPQGKFESITVEGRRTLTALQGPRGRSALEIFTN